MTWRTGKCRSGVAEVRFRQGCAREHEESDTESAKNLLTCCPLCSTTTSILGRTLRLTFQALRILGLFLDNPKSEVTGADIIRESGLASGTVYPLLLRFERVGFLESYWEAKAPTLLGHPRRSFYKITPQGMAFAIDALRHLRPDRALVPEVL